MATSRISFQVRSSSPDLNLSIFLNNQLIQSPLLSNEYAPVVLEFPDDDEQDLVLCLQMSGKTIDHTSIDDQGNIVNDHVIEIKDFAIEEIALGHTLVEKSIYEHDFNGTGKTTQHPFYGVMGCNGTVTLKFSTPVYLWLLENM